MTLEQWLAQNGHTQAWLAQQLGVRPARVSQAFRLRREGKRGLPPRWIPAVQRITDGAVSIKDEWADLQCPPAHARAA